MDVDTKTQLDQLRISQSLPDTIALTNGRSVSIRPIACGVADLISGYLVRQSEVNESPETAELIAKMRPNLKYQSKAIALALLQGGKIGYLKIKLFHWIYWRIVFWKYSSVDYSIILEYLVEKISVVFFYQNMALTKGMNTLKRKMTTKEVEQLQAEQELEKKQDS